MKKPKYGLRLLTSLLAMALFSLTLILNSAKTNEIKTINNRAAEVTPPVIPGFGKALSITNADQFTGNGLSIFRGTSSTKFSLGTNFTIEFWVKFDETPQPNEILLRIGQDRIQMRVKDPNSYPQNYFVEITGVGQTFYPKARFRANTWHHVAISNAPSPNTGNLLLYVDGVYEHINTPYSDIASDDIEIAKLLNAQIDEVRISNIHRYPTVLGDTNRYTKPTAPFADNDPNNLVLLHLDENTLDSSSYNRNGTVGNNVTYVDSTVVPIPTPTITLTPKPTLVPRAAPYHPVFHSFALPSGRAGIAYSTKVSAADSNSQDILALSSDNLPAGMTLGNCVSAVSTTNNKSVSCVLSGTIPDAGTYPFSLKVTDNQGNHAINTYTLVMTNSFPQISTLYLAKPRPGAKYTGTVSGYDVNSKDDLSMTLQGLPEGLIQTCSTVTDSTNKKVITCKITGTTSALGTHPITVTLDDKNGGEVRKVIPLVVAMPTTPTLTPSPTLTPTPTVVITKRMFITSTQYNGNLGGLSGADAKCQARANAGGLGGSWKAWLSDDTTSASSRMIPNNGPYKLARNGWIIANSWDDLVDGSNLQQAIFQDELGGYWSTYQAWTNTNPNGEKVTGYSNNCLNWTSVDRYTYGAYGSAVTGSPDWSYVSWHPCSLTTKRLYCIEQ